MKGIILASHGLLADGMLDALKLFSGEPEQIKSLCLLPGEDINVFLENLCKSIDEVDTGDGVIIFCDLLFGTPCNCCGALLGKKEYSERIQIITGMNLPMILEYVGTRESDTDASSILETGKTGIVDFNKLHKERNKN